MYRLDGISVSMINISVSQDSPPKGSPKLHLKLKKTIF